MFYLENETSLFICGKNQYLEYNILLRNIIKKIEVRELNQFLENSLLYKIANLELLINF